MPEWEDEDQVDRLVGAAIPKGALVNCQISLAQYVDPEDSKLKFSISYSGDVPLTQFYGLLRMGEMELTRISRAEWEEED